MAHFAKVENGIVTNVIVIDQETLNTGHWGDPALWIQTSYNTSAGVHLTGGTPLRKNFAGIGYTYDAVRDAFIPPCPFPSWILNETTCLYEAPKEQPPHGGVWDEATSTWTTVPKGYAWDEATLDWVEV